VNRPSGGKGFSGLQLAFVGYTYTRSEKPAERAFKRSVSSKTDRPISIFDPLMSHLPLPPPTYRASEDAPSANAVLLLTNSKLDKRVQALEAELAAIQATIVDPDEKVPCVCMY
jgi:hypothetical protein